MTLNGIIALILLYFTEFDSFAGLLRHSAAEYLLILSVMLTHFTARSLCDS